MNLYQRILKETDGLDGWCEPGKQIALANLVLALKPRVIVEVGVWGGKSLIPMAMAAQSDLRSLANPAIYAIDPWKADESIKGQHGEDAKWWASQSQHDLVLARFREALARLDLNWVQVHRKTSNEMALHPYLSDIDILHIDGNHGPQAVKDVERFSPCVPVGGVVVLDDLNWTGGAVGKAAEWLKANGFIELHPLGTGAVYMRL